MAAKYYVLAKSLWQGDNWSPIAGPFTNEVEAKKVADENAHDGWTKPVWSEQHQAYWAPTQDLKAVVNTRVVNTTKMRKVYGWTTAQALEQIFYIEQLQAEMATWPEPNYE